MQEKEYLEVLIQSLRKKLVVLNQISILNQEQREILRDENIDPDTFELNVKNKGALIDQLNVLDAGFDEVYAHIKELMERDHGAYTEELKQMQKLIRLIMEKDTKVRAEEQRNYELAQRVFSDIKSKVREVKASQKMVSSYYKTIAGQKAADAMFLDNKQ